MKEQTEVKKYLTVEHKTVEMRGSHIYTKLGIKHRHEQTESEFRHNYTSFRISKIPIYQHEIHTRHCKTTITVNLINIQGHGKDKAAQKNEENK